MDKGAVCPFIKFDSAHTSIQLLIGTITFWTAAKNVEFISEADTPAARKKYVDDIAEAMAAARDGKESQALNKKSPDNKSGPDDDKELIKQLTSADDDDGRILILDCLVKDKLDQGHLSEAKTYAAQLDSLVRKHETDPDYNDSISDANVELGRLALKSGDLMGAKARLLASGDTSGGPILHSDGPDMSLARDLLEKKEIAVVLQYIQSCKKFWKDDKGKLDKWTDDIKTGRMPDFSGNLGE